MYLALILILEQREAHLKCALRSYTFDISLRAVPN